MSIVKVRILYGSFFILFLIVAVAIFFFGLGFRYNLKKRSVAQYGGIAFSVTPGDAAVWIDGTQLPSSDPFLISGLTPGSHAVRIERTGYFPWGKRVTVQPGISTNLSRLFLFPARNAIAISRPLPFRIPSREPFSPSDSFTIQETPRQLLVTHREANGEARLPNFTGKKIFSDRSKKSLIVFAPSQELFSFTFPAQGELKTEIASGIESWEDTDQWLIFWGLVDLWAFDKLRLEKILVSRRSNGFSTAQFYRDNVLFFVSGHQLFATDIRDRFGRYTAPLLSFDRMDDLFIVRDTVYVHGVLSQENTAPEWFEYRIIP